MSSVQRPEGLPSSWTIEVKGSDEEKRECYIDPESGREFHSMLEVSDYLNTINSSKATEKTKTGDKSPSGTVVLKNSEAANVAEDISENKQGTSEKSNEKNAVSGTQVDGLPPGWIKVIIVKRAKGRTRKDPYYLDPLSDYAFLSKLDALRYLETGDTEKCAMKPKKKGELLMKSSNTPTKTKSAGKRSAQKSNETKKSTSTPPSRASKRLKTSETVEPQSEEQPEKEKNEGGYGETEEVKDKEPDVEKSTNDEKTEVPLIPEPVKTVNSDVLTEVPEIPMSVPEESVGIEERNSEVANEATNL